MSDLTRSLIRYTDIKKKIECPLSVRLNRQGRSALPGYSRILCFEIVCFVMHRLILFKPKSENKNFNRPANTCTCPLKTYAVKNLRA